MNNIVMQDNVIVFEFDYNKDVANQLKLVGAKWNPIHKIWYLEKIKFPNINKALLVALENAGFDIPQNLRNLAIDVSARVIKLSKDKRYIIYKFPYIPTIKDFVKNNCFATFKSTAKGKFWVTPVSGANFFFDNIKFFAEHQFDIDEEVFRLRDELQDIQEHSSTDILSNEIVWEDYTPNGKNLYGFQKLGVEFIWRKNNRCLLGFAMGLGKTPMALVSLNKDYLNKTPIIVVCPNVAKYVWYNHIKDWLLHKNMDKVYVIDAHKQREIPKDAEIVIVNYDMLHRTNTSDLKYKTLIIDEAHHIRNSKRRISKDEREKKHLEKSSTDVIKTKQIFTIGETANNIIAISGTPFVNKPIELYNIIKLLDPVTFSNKSQYAKMFCDMKPRMIYTKQGRKTIYDMSGSSNLDKLHDLLTSTVMIRKLKEDVLTELPDKQRTMIPINVVSSDEESALFQINNTAQEEVNKIILENKMGSKISFEAKQMIFSTINKLRQETFKVKYKYVLDFLKEILSQKEKVVVFVYHRIAYDAIKKFLDKKEIKWVGILGGDSDDSRKNAETSFQNDGSIRVFLGSIKASNEAITLTKSSDVVFVEFAWSPGDMTQAEDRCHRITQKNSVNIYYLVLNNSVDVNMVELLTTKMNVLQQALDGKTKEVEGNKLNMFDSFIDGYIGRGNKLK